jgi:hypothetical protein
MVDRLGVNASDHGVDLSKLVAISAQERRCDCGGCCRLGMPLISGKVDCVHSLQGLSIGEGEMTTRMVLHWNKDAEGMWPGIFYVGASRAKATENIVLQNGFTTADKDKIGNDKRWREQHEEVHRIHEKADSEFEAFNDGGVRFKAAMRWLIEHMRHVHGSHAAITRSQDVLEGMTQWEATLDALQ